MDQPTQPAITPGGVQRPSGTPPGPVVLTPRQQADLLAAMKRPGWSIVGSTATPHIETHFDNLNRPVYTATGEYDIWVQDPQGRAQPATLMKGGAYPDDPETNTWTFSKMPEDVPKPQNVQDYPKTQTATGKDGTVWERDPATGVWKPQIQGQAPNPDEDMITFMKREKMEQDRAQEQRNEAAGNGYLTDSDLLTFNQKARQLGISEDQQKLEREKFGQAKKIEEAKLEDELKQMRASASRDTAGAALANAQAGKVGSDVNIQEQKVGPEIEEMGARTGLSKAQAKQVQQATQIAGAPDYVTGPTGMTAYTRDPKTGVTTEDINRGWVPKTQADVAARMGQLQSAAQAMKDKLQNQVTNKELTSDQAMQQWNAWWQNNIESQKGALAAAQEEVQYQRTKDAQEAQRSAYATALTAGSNAATAVNAQSARRVGPGFAQAANQIMSGTPLSQVDIGRAVTYRAPNITQVADQAVNEALKHISPGAAAATGSPMPTFQGIDINAGLDQTRYMPSFMGGPPPGPPSGPPPGPPSGPPPPPPAPPSPVVGQNYGPATAYTNGVNPWDFQYTPSF